MNTAPNVRIIPAKPQTAENRDKYHQLRVAAYCRVSTEQEEQQNSYQVQIAYYTDLINRKKEWTLAGIFADEGISGTQAKKRPEFLKMIRLCDIDLVITRSIFCFLLMSAFCAICKTADCLKLLGNLDDCSRFNFLPHICSAKHIFINDCRIAVSAEILLIFKNTLYHVFIPCRANAVV